MYFLQAMEGSNDRHKGHRDLATTNLPLKAGKGWLCEGGIRVPLFIKCPNHIEPKQDDKSIVLGMDIFTTLLDLTINKTVFGVDEQSYKNVLTGNETWENRTVY